MLPLTLRPVVNAPAADAMIQERDDRFQISVGTRALISGSFAVIIAILFLLQLQIGGWNVVLLVLCVLSLTTLIPFIFRFWCAADFLWLVFSMYIGLFPLVIKTMLGQPVSSNLLAPSETAGYITVGTSSAALGYLLARQIARPRGAPFNMTFLTANPVFLRRYAFPLYLLGFMAAALHASLRSRFDPGQASEGFGGLGVLALLWMAGLSFQAVRWRERVGRTTGIVLVLMMAGLIVLGILNNVKKPLVDGAVIVVLSLVVHRGRFPIGKLVMLALPFPVLLLYIAPLIQVMRPQLKTFTPSEIVEVATRSLQEADYSPQKLSDKVDQIMQGYTREFLPNGTYLFPSPVNADRFTLIMPIDQVARNLPRSGTMGLASLSDVPETYLPGPLYTKTGIASADLISWYYGIRTNQVISRPVIGLIASSMAVDDMVGAIFLPFLTFLLFYSVVNLVAGPLRSGAWAAFVIGSFLQEGAEKEVSGIIAIGARELPLVLLIAWGLYAITRYIFRLPAGQLRAA